MTAANILSSSKANRLFWLGRYAERVYTSLHLVRKYLDKMIDSDSDCYRMFCNQLGIPDIYTSAEDFRCRFLYDEESQMSLITSMRRAFDNAIELREEIKSENLSYIELALNTMRKCSNTNAKCDELQPVTDNLLAFWGGLEERMSSREAKDLLRLGRQLESLELHIRFQYDMEHIRSIYDTIDAYISRLPEVYSKQYYAELNSLMRSSYDTSSAEFRNHMITAINSLFIVSL